MTVVVTAMIIVGLAFLTVSSIGLLRLPDFYSRTHAAGKSETLGAILILGGSAIYNGIDIASIKLAFILVFFAIANPTAIHAIARAAFISGIDPWTVNHKPEQVDEIFEEEESSRSSPEGRCE